MPRFSLGRGGGTGGDVTARKEIIKIINQHIPHGGRLPVKVVYMVGQDERLPPDPLSHTMPYDLTFISLQVGALLLGWTGIDNETKYDGDTAFNLEWTDLDAETEADWNAGDAPTKSCFAIDTDGDYDFEAHIFNSTSNDPNLSLGLSTYNQVLTT